MEALLLQFIEGQAENLPFESATFELVLAMTVRCFVRDAKWAVREMARVLKPGGRLVIGDLGRWSVWAAQRRIRGWMGNPTWQAVTFRTARELCSLAREVGLEVI